MDVSSYPNNLVNWWLNRRTRADISTCSSYYSIIPKVEYHRLCSIAIKLLVKRPSEPDDALHCVDDFEGKIGLGTGGYAERGADAVQARHRTANNAIFFPAYVE